MTELDLARMSDRELFAHVLFGDLARPGWSGRRRAMARRALSVAGMTLAAIFIVLGFGLAIVLAWAATLPAPR